MSRKCVECGKVLNYSNDLTFEYRKQVVKNLEGYVCSGCGAKLFIGESNKRIQNELRRAKDGEKC